MLELARCPQRLAGMVRFSFNICHDGEWELREGDAVVGRCATRGEVVNLARAMVTSARMRGDEADYQETGPCPEPPARG